MVKSRVALYQKTNVTRSTIYVENFMLVSETAQGWYYAALLYGVNSRASVIQISMHQFHHKKVLR